MLTSLQTIYCICPYRGQGSNSGRGSGGQFINRGRVWIVARFAAIDTNASRSALLCSLATASSLSHFTVAKDHQSCSLRESCMISPSSWKLLSAQRRQPRKPLPWTLYTWWPLTTLSFTTELVTCESWLAWESWLAVILPHARRHNTIHHWFYIGNKAKY